MMPSPSRGPRRSTIGWRRRWRRVTRRRSPTIAPRRPMPARPIRRMSISCRCTWPSARQARARTDARSIGRLRWGTCRWRLTPSTKPHPEERRAAARLEGWSPSFETRPCGPLLRMRQIALRRVRQRDALFLHELLEFAGLEHLTDDVTAAHELALHVELRDGRPLAEFLDALAQLRVDQDVDAVELHAELAQALDDGGREAALREHRRALHEQQHVVLADLVANAIKNLRLAHIDLLKRPSGRGSDLNIRPLRPLRHGGQ